MGCQRGPILTGLKMASRPPFGKGFSPASRPGACRLPSFPWTGLTAAPPPP